MAFKSQSTFDKTRSERNSPLLTALSIAVSDLSKTSKNNLVERLRYPGARKYYLDGTSGLLEGVAGGTEDFFVVELFPTAK